MLLRAPPSGGAQRGSCGERVKSEPCPSSGLASYPKSGNTWLRTVLTSYMEHDGTPVSINGLVGFIVTNRQMFDEVFGLPSSDLTPDEILRLRPLFHALLAAELPHPTFVRTYDTSIQTVAGAVYLVGTPRTWRSPMPTACNGPSTAWWS